ncbi:MULTISPECIES: methyl-accepting chemotaxis protein [unclassified Undibacterium]|uniref:methyl-accepting chemotaxis protein n=1 Tax=unclassified Undibacterium TaxID=2630295 RepID=UPI002AC8D0E7|nr:MULTISPECIES: methyl-accepting chemotaxis protein [unclassified Undibacterium]MEB0140946.1 methyl-accepting chemotaxis protein [Undibacterium sp. CCC2.1]MEB0173939.1 methyl-accepting chemotaxis protein [Undibacterium sp. CCC1.1]MEB0177162.1 methyl-accepting chemotaxis protein [Undibacterium sp. CCC3.4]MEB0217116.1 methyl-accepting chemotaxis protein [Undibacterium sp. 5I2]WPX43166.1 methyl-accepting chemotaxis protein [Undibacterium sp. CCC3.4]
MTQLKVSTRLHILNGLLALLLLAVGLIGLYGVNKSNNSLKTVYEDRVICLGQLAEVNYLLQRNRVLVMDMLLQPAPEHVAKRNTELRSNVVQASKVWAEYMATYLTPDEQVLAKNFDALRLPYVQEALLPAADAMLAGQNDAALAIYTGKISVLAPAVNLASQKLNQLQLDVSKSEYDVAVANYGFIRTLSLAAIALGVLFAAVFGSKLVRDIGHELGAEPGEAAGLARRVAAGDLSQAIVLENGDAASMMAQLKTMQESLVVVVGNVRLGSESIAAASAEIAQGNHDLSARTENQASALEQTAASMEELGSTVKQNADNVRQANQLAMSAQSFANKGGAVVSQVVDTMKEINQASRKIADIIGVIDGIAFQTNILALNAAVEAARAGEQGRGFAVVASEVRSLAGRSAEAAKEIKTLITTSVDRVQQGTNLVDEAGETIAEVVNSIQKVTDLIAEINAASHEQALGIGQIGQALTQMDQNTQQNAALVEQMAAAASLLKGQAQDLVVTVGVFKLDQHHVAALVQVPSLGLRAAPAQQNKYQRLA